MDKIIGRYSEKKRLEQIYNSGKNEFVAVLDEMYGKQNQYSSKLV